MKDIDMIFARNISEIIKRKKLNYHIVAELSGISSASLRRWMEGERIPNLKYVYELAETLGVRPEELVKI